MLLVGWPLPPAFDEDESLTREAGRYAERRVLHAMVGITALSGARRAAYDDWCPYVPSPSGSALLCRFYVPEGVSPAKFAKKAMDGMNQAVNASELSEAVYTTQYNLSSMVSSMFGMVWLSPGADPFAHRMALGSHFSENMHWNMMATNGYAQVTPQTVDDRFEQWFERKYMVARLLVPEGQDVNALVELKKGRSEMAAGGERSKKKIEYARERPLITIPPVVPDVPADVEVTTIENPPPKLNPVVKKTLANGINVYILPYGEVDVVRAVVAARGGPSDDSKPGLDEWAWDQIKFDRDGVPGNSYLHASFQISLGL